MRREYKNNLSVSDYHIYYYEDGPPPWMRIDFVLTKSWVNGNAEMMQQNYVAGIGYTIVVKFIIQNKK